LKELPAAYFEYFSLDLAQNRKAAVILNLVGIPLLIGCGWLFVRLAQRLNPAFAEAQLTVSFLTLFLTLLAIFSIVLLHEAVHGLFLWLFTNERPIYGYSWYYAYAGAPDWYLPKLPYIAVALAPLIMITLAGVGLLPFVPGTAVIPLIVALTTNAAGAIGDVAVVLWVLAQPADVLVRDSGPAFSAYRQDQVNGR
jgi:hypothetical protein